MILFSPLFFIGCGGGGGGDDDGGTASTAAVVDEASVNKGMEWVEESIPGCQIVEASQIAAGILGLRKNFDQSSALIGLFATLAAAKKQAPDYLTSIELAPIEIQGDCGGTLTVGSAHSNGVTTYTLVFKNYCLADETTSPPGETKINGKLIAKEIGTPGDSGPVISKYTAATDGKLTVATGVDRISVMLVNFTYKLGVPGVEPGTPTQAHPDQVTLDQLSVNFETQKRLMTLSNLSAMSYESGDNSVAELASGRFSISDRGYVDVSTSQPVVMNSDGDLISGSVDFAGAEGNVVTVSAGSETGSFSVELNGEPMDAGMDCSSIALDNIPLL